MESNKRIKSRKLGTLGPAVPNCLIKVSRINKVVLYLRQVMQVGYMEVQVEGHARLIRFDYPTGYTVDNLCLSQN